MFRFYLISLGPVVGLFALLATTTVSMFVFKQKLHSLKSELANLDATVLVEKKRSATLEAGSTLHHSSGYLKKIADRKLHARFTTVKQFVAINDLKRKERTVVAN